MNYLLLLKTYSFVIASWLYIFLIFLGLGMLVIKFFKTTPFSSESLFASFWIGFGIILFILQIWQLFFKVDLIIFIIISILGLFGIVFNYKILWKFLKNSYSKFTFFYIALVFILAIWLTHRAILPIVNFDCAAYHITSIKWLNSYPIIPGLGNLWGNLAYNNSSFLYVAFLESGFWAQKSSYVANGVFLLFMLSYIVFCIFKFFANKSNIKFYTIIMILLFAPVFRESWIGNLSSPSPDLPIFLIEIAVAYFFLRFIENYKNPEDMQEFDIYTILIISATGIITKLSFIVFGLTILLVTVILWLIKIKSYFNLFKLRFISIFSVCLIGVISWIVRGVILSGYPFYPITFTPFNFDWKLPKSDLIYMINLTKGWARNPNTNWAESIGNWSWLKTWVINYILNRLELILPIILLVTSLIILLSFYTKIRNNLSLKKIILLFSIPFIFSIIYWFFTAPDPGYAGSIIWIFSIGLFAIALLFNVKSNKIKLSSKILILLLSIFITITYTWYYLPLKGEKKFSSTLIKEKNISMAAKEIYFENYYFPISTFKRSWVDNAFYDIPEIKMLKFTTNSGLTIFVPEENSFWGVGNCCWNGPLPCTPYPNPKLKLRVDNNLRYGFKIED